MVVNEADQDVAFFSISRDDQIIELEGLAAGSDRLLDDLLFMPEGTTLDFAWEYANGEEVFSARSGSVFGGDGYVERITLEPDGRVHVYVRGETRRLEDTDR